MKIEYNSENTSDANSVHLESNFLFSLSLLLETEIFDQCGTNRNYKAPFFHSYKSVKVLGVTHRSIFVCNTS